MPAPVSIAVARQAMATRFEIVLQGENAAHLRAAAEEALDEVERLDAQLSLYRASSDIREINARAGGAPVRVEPRLFGLLQRCRELTEATGGAFDITLGPLMRCWGFMGAAGATPSPEALAEARARVGMERVELDAAACTVRLAQPGMMLDLGSVGKGYAIERAVELLAAAEVRSGLIHGGTSSVHALGVPLEGGAWRVAIAGPPGGWQGGGEGAPLEVVELRDESLSVSAVHGKAFTVAGRVYGHVLDPRCGAPVMAARLAAVTGRSATEMDALSTVLLVTGGEDMGRWVGEVGRLATRAWVVRADGGVLVG